MYVAGGMLSVLFGTLCLYFAICFLILFIVLCCRWPSACSNGNESNSREFEHVV